jgi:UDP-N-acetylmuramoyl-L-alanyl-D-glutamate--2,6-diaminopimelate ligase
VGAEWEQPRIPTVVVRDTRRAMAELAAAFWGWPSRQMKVIGVTGTNGKTTTTMLVASIARAAGMRAGVLGTLGLIAGGHITKTEHTTLEAPDLQETLADMAAQGIELVAMEVSSHGLALDRVWQTYFDVGVITNITRDHLDFHKSLEEYAAAKKLLLTCYAELARPHKQMRAVVNWDDERARNAAREARCELIRYSMESCEAEVRAEDVSLQPRRTQFRLVLPTGRHDVTLGLIGRFNVENALAAAACAVALGISGETVAQGLANAPQTPGRLERVEVGQDFLVLVDYCHTPDAVAKVLKEARRLAQGRVICVIGCGGDRDRGKRPKMGAAATELADWTIITSDNPRSEDPWAIIQAIIEGAQEGRYEAIEDRAEAIKKAVGMAREGDVVVIGGKGHEDYQIIGSRKIHFDDREQARKAVLMRQAR